MKKLIIFPFIIIIFNACSVTSHYRINSNLEFKKISTNERKTYILFGKEQAIRLIESNKQEEASDNFSDEFEEVIEPIDPLQTYNRVMTSINDILYINFLIPIAKGYSNVIPEPVRVSISNFIHNIIFPIRFINNILQFKFSYATEELGRFVINSTAGILGFIDPAKKYLNLEKREEDFGQTLGYYGAGEGFHIVFPIYGPSNLRDSIGNIANVYISPLTNQGSLKYKIPNRFEKTLGIEIVDAINRTSLNLGKYENLKKDAIDLYPFLRDIYTQTREKQIKE